MKYDSKYMTVIAAAVVGLGLSVSAGAQDTKARAMDGDMKAYGSAKMRCDSMSGAERTKCMKDAETRYPAAAKADQPKSPNETAGAMQKSPNGSEREMGKQTSAPAKGSSEIMGDKKGPGASTVPGGTTGADRKATTGGATSPAPAKGSSELAGDKKGAGASTVPK